MVMTEKIMRTEQQIKAEIEKLTKELDEVRYKETDTVYSIPKTDILPIARRLKKLMRTTIKVSVPVSVFWEDGEVDFDAEAYGITRIQEYKDAYKLLKSEEKAIDNMMKVLLKKYKMDDEQSEYLWDRVYQYM